MVNFEVWSPPEYIRLAIGAYAAGYPGPQAAIALAIVPATDS